MLRDGILCRSESSWSSALHIVPSQRCLQSAQRLNHPLPQYHPSRPQLLPPVFGCSFFSKIYLVRLYNYIPFHPDNIQVYVTQSFKRFMADILQELDFCFTYLDEILFFWRSLEEYKQHLRALFDQHGILINPAKCVLWVSEVTLLSYIVSAEGSRPLEEWVAHLQDCPPPFQDRQSALLLPAHAELLQAIFYPRQCYRHFFMTFSPAWV
jgi:hypothetical protein